MAFRKTYLIQALNRPVSGNGPFGKINPFSFGGGGSGLSKEALEMLADLWDWEYMGASEYEFGAPREALATIASFAKDKTLTASVRMIEAREVNGDYLGLWYSKGTNRVKVPVYVIAPTEWLPQIDLVLTSLLTDDPVLIPGSYSDTPSAIRLKCDIRFWNALMDPSVYWGDDRRRFIGGLELDNGWQFFIDQEAFIKVCAFWDLKAPDLTGVKTYVPPRAMRSNEGVEKRVMAALDAPKPLIDLFNTVYEHDFKVGDVVPEEFVPLVKQVESRMKVLMRKKLVTKDRKTKLYSKA